MKRIPAYLAAAVMALFWAADGRAANDPDETIATELPILNVPISGRLPNSFDKLSSHLPVSEFDFSGDLPKSFLHIAEELNHPDGQNICEALPNSFLKISARLPERPDTEDVAKYGLNEQVNLSDHLPNSFLKIGSQYPTTKEN
jgi:hypothetical protein